MTFSFTDKKRIRKDFGKQPSILEVPSLLSIQLDSYQQFLQEETASDTQQMAARISGCTPLSRASFRSSVIPATQRWSTSATASASRSLTSRSVSFVV